MVGVIHVDLHAGIRARLSPAQECVKEEAAISMDDGPFELDAAGSPLPFPSTSKEGFVGMFGWSPELKCLDWTPACILLGVRLVGTMNNLPAVIRLNRFVSRISHGFCN